LGVIFPLLLLEYLKLSLRGATRQNNLILQIYLPFQLPLSFPTLLCHSRGSGNLSLSFIISVAAENIFFNFFSSIGCVFSSFLLLLSRGRNIFLLTPSPLGGRGLGTTTKSLIKYRNNLLEYGLIKKIVKQRSSSGGYDHNLYQIVLLDKENILYPPAERLVEENEEIKRLSREEELKWIRHIRYNVLKGK